MSYPPEPWHLRGRMYVSVFGVPVADLPPLPAALASLRPVRLGRRALVGAAWVDYEPGGVLSYRELLVSTLTRDGLRPRVTITGIWVDSVPSRDGGRALWGIPKELAAFELTGTDASAAAEGGPLATAVLRRRLLPFRVPVGFKVAQDLGGRPKTSPVRATARPGTARVTWDVAPGGPLGYLAGRRPLLSFAIGDFDMRFGAAAPAGA
ncbi:acetoacetate decarboxylase family protein [Hamadaea tsunoensis]|uniref:acetoacetate decarboxylase family protein n=1 Tax=Hamadaea tsunoensis TaxID=53368 RepID=UPI000482E087|nr:acetoacetate decarboxylase family protein [Hamadaea tsunoensis]